MTASSAERARRFPSSFPILPDGSDLLACEPKRLRCGSLRPRRPIAMGARCPGDRFAPLAAGPNSDRAASGGRR